MMMTMMWLSCYIFATIGIIFSFILLLAYCIAAAQVTAAAAAVAVFTFAHNVRNALNFSVLRCSQSITYAKQQMVRHLSTFK